ncbi:gag-pol fusion protein [Sugiyamaella lignohabitans]|uniref:Gag-pol fusion protein n=1 Tax=Sugiyamaella lignohabitans TaxID=796027 RepID=A0A161HH93_9ASCO|nr:gag-pol fusion protein [Sugiyamaella lignohabitans]ANB11457.1 gag-pol fusion protein [Sugiyamaella lignohabitans]
MNSQPEVIFGCDWIFRTNFVLNSSHAGRQIEIVSTSKPTTPLPHIKRIAPSLPPIYQQYASLFTTTVNTVPELRESHNHSIPFKDNPTYHKSKSYPLSAQERTILKEYIQTNLKKGFIRESRSPLASSIFFVKKKHTKEKRPIIDYRRVNNNTKPCPSPIPLIKTLLHQVSKAKIFTRLDLKDAYNQIRITPGDEWKTSFVCEYGQFEYTVMPFGLSGAPATFQAFIRHVLGELWDKFAVAYLDDILIYSEDPAEHPGHVMAVLDKIKKYHLALKLSKCEFSVTETDFLGHHLMVGQIGMQKEKIQSLNEWKSPSTQRGVRKLLGFANFYHEFIDHYADIIAPLLPLQEKSTKRFQWTPTHEQAFQSLKRAFISEPLLQMFDETRETRIHTDASGVAIAAVLQQFNPVDKRWHPVAYYSRKLRGPEINWDTHDRELLAIVVATGKWKHFILSRTEPTTVHTDHKNLTYFTTKRALSPRQARWASLLGELPIQIAYIQGHLNVAADILSRPDDVRKPPREVAPPVPVHHILPAVRPQTVSTYTMDPTWQTKVHDALANDKNWSPLLTHFENPSHPFPSQFIDRRSRLTFANGIIWFDKKIVVGNSNELHLAILQQYHDASGHPGHARTQKAILERYYWKGIHDFIQRYINSCVACQKNKTPRHKPYGELKPLPIPEAPFTDLTIDFMTDLPKSQGYDAICAVVDRYSKFTLLFPTNKTITARGLADLVVDRVLNVFGAPKRILSDRGPQFISAFWKQAMASFGTKVKLTTPYHPQTDGQTERINQEISQWLRFYINSHHNNWSKLLSRIAFDYNNKVNKTTGFTPSQVVFNFKTISDLNYSAADNYEDLSKKLFEYEEIRNSLSQNYARSQKSYKKFYDRHRVAFEFNPGDSVLLSTKHLNLPTIKRKFSRRWIGPFLVHTKVNENAYRLNFPSGWRASQVWNITELRPFQPDLCNRKQPLPTTSEDIDFYSNNPLGITEILQVNGDDPSNFQYLVEVIEDGFPQHRWVPYSKLSNYHDLLLLFYEFHPKEPKPAELDSLYQAE